MNQETRWTPRVTVAAVIEREGRFLLVEEQQSRGLVLNNASGHLDIAESLPEACVREVLEETGFDFTPEALVGVYLSRYRGHDPVHNRERDLTFLRFTFCGALGDFHPERELDTPIVRTLWMTPEEIHASRARHRSPMVLRSLQDYLDGHRFPLDTIHADASVAHPADFGSR
ncbi:MAG: NUDIX hydrolase [Brachymonas sp.]|nr:NUDIX hydrolase [Brachymonas sp.]